jgi:ParB-like chromosome segregation protein Spo0J
MTSSTMVEKARVDERLRLQVWPTERVLPSPRNARTHSGAQVAEIAGSIRAFGFTNPILIGEAGEVIAGHGRLAAARLLGLVEVPVILLKGLSEMQQRQLMLADNRIALNAGWDLDLLQLELKDLAALGADLKVLGFTKGELAKALTPAHRGLTDEDHSRGRGDSRDASRRRLGTGPASDRLWRQHRPGPRREDTGRGLA